MPDEPTPPTEKKPSKAMSKTALALGAAGLFLFIVGVKRKHRLDSEREVDLERERRARRGMTERERGGPIGRPALQSPRTP